MNERQLTHRPVNPTMPYLGLGLCRLWRIVCCVLWLAGRMMFWLVSRSRPWWDRRELVVSLMRMDAWLSWFDVFKCIIYRIMGCFGYEVTINWTR